MLRQRLIVIALAGGFFAAQAQAASVTMLQFGSYETRAEAEAKLAEVKAKHAAVVGALPSSIREVKLPPDNVVYRTQAGPLPNKEAAQSVCAQLATNGVECYVVQTVMVAGADSVPIVGAQAVAAAPNVSVPAVAQPALVAAKSALASGAAAPPALPPMPSLEPAKLQSIPLLPSRSMPLSSAAPTISAAPTVLAAAPRLVAPLNAGIASAESAIAQATPALPDMPALPPAPGFSPTPFNDAALAKPSPELMAALERAAAANGEPSLLVSIPKPEAASSNSSFWSRLNPFGSSTGEPLVSGAPIVAAPVLVAAAVPEATQAVPAPADKTEPKQALAQLPPPPAPVVNAAPAFNVSPIEIRAVPVTQLAASAMAAPPAPMPPSPAPVVNAAPAVNVSPIEIRAVPATQLAASAMAAPPAPMPPPLPERLASIPSAPPLETNVITKAEPLRLPPPPPPLFANRTLPNNVPAAAAPLPLQAMPTTGNVRVEEAKRVPLSESVMVPPAPPVASVPAPLTPPPALYPSATLGQKTIWGQIGQFADTQAALAFWDSYRQRYPDFPAVRVRVTAPYQAKQRGDERVWLRVGPFQRDGFITNLCATMPQNTELRCGKVQDMGYAGSPNRTPGFLPGSRYNR